MTLVIVDCPVWRKGKKPGVLTAGTDPAEGPAVKEKTASSLWLNAWDLDSIQL